MSRTAKESYLPVPGFPNYFISDYGRVKVVKDYMDKGSVERFVKMDPNKATVRLKNGQGAKFFKVGRLVAEVFLPEDSDGRKRICHLDGDITNNKVANLKWEGLTRNNIKEIRLRIAEGDSYSAVARAFSTNTSHVKRIIERKVWKEVSV